MTKKRFTPSEGRKDVEHHLDNQPSRDIQALILPLSLIVVPENIRTEVTGIEELAASIGKNGLLQPLVVSRVDLHFELVAGQRRLGAIKKLGWETAPVRILNANADQIVCLRILENTHRKSLAGIDEVRAVAKLLPIFNQNQSAVARALGVQQAFVSRCSKAAKWLEDHPTYVAPHSLSKSMLFQLCESQEPEKLLEEIKTGNVATTREARKLSGALPGGRAVDRFLQFKPRTDGKGFSLRIQLSPSTPEGSKTQIIETLEQILKQLKEP